MPKFTKLQDTMHFTTSQDSFIKNHKDVNQYFQSCIKKIFVAKQYYNPKRYEFVKFQDYLDKRYKDSCYHYSSYAIMGLLGNDYIVRGKIDIDETGNCSYEHGWVEFSFDGKEYVFDSLNYSIVEKELYYEHMKPIITYKSSLEETLDTFTSSKYSIQISENTFKVKSFDLIYNQYTKVDSSHLFLPLSDSEIIIDDNENQLVKKFTGYR